MRFGWKYILLLLVLAGFVSAAYAVELGKADSLAKKFSQGEELLQNTADRPAISAPLENIKPYNINWTGVITRTIFAIVFVIALIYFFIRLMKILYSRRKMTGNLPVDLFQVLGSAPLTHNKNVMVLKFYDSIYLVSVADNQVSLIDKIDDMQKVGNIEHIIPSAMKFDAGFQKVLKKTVNKYK